MCSVSGGRRRESKEEKVCSSRSCGWRWPGEGKNGCAERHGGQSEEDGVKAMPGHESEAEARVDSDSKPTHPTDPFF